MYAAGGMESDFSDSDCDIVFSSKDSSKAEAEATINKSNPNTFSNGVIKTNDFIPSSHSSVTSQSSYANQRSHRKFSRRQCIDVNSSQLLDDLRYAVNQGNVETVKAILSKDIWVDTILKSGWTSLMFACSAGNLELVQFLLEEKANPNYHKDMLTPLMAVCMSKKNEEDLSKCCSLLIDNGANVNAHERHLTTPLMFASREGYTQIVKTLLDNDAEINAQDNRGNTAIAWAAQCGHGQVVRLLLEKGADVKILNRMGQSPIDLAYDHDHSEVASLLTKGVITKEDSTIDRPNITVKTASGDAIRIAMSVRDTSSSKTFVKVGELDLFLNGIGCPELIPVFNEQQLNFHDLLIMNDEELEKVGIKQIGTRKKILEACKAVHKKDWENSSLPNLRQKQYISCPDAVAMMANIAKHLKYISSSIIYIRQQIQSQPRILELSQDSANVHDLLDEMEDGLKNVRFLNDEMRFLKMHLEKVQDKVQFIPADLIVETVPTGTKYGKIFLSVIGVTAASVVVVGLLWKNNYSFSNLNSIFKFRALPIAL
ncbi:ankyrin repeat, SAM and basic leucine zipper domain-containing protein 1-like [Uloborus diversus]|uniref:ankyrin repeat, SAM and basic leucine zipper domain-containing protein 1-like n=1 Tax=Uloborus diversus TaxID=327109 RepID=UPI0024094841|nr:ankyrin repeat, SAM and basic leucine zipper domain-containing protein 1-like [Uloborus diversus]